MASGWDKWNAEHRGGKAEPFEKHGYEMGAKAAQAGKSEEEATKIVKPGSPYHKAITAGHRSVTGANPITTDSLQLHGAKGHYQVHIGGHSVTGKPGLDSMSAGTYIGHITQNGPEGAFNASHVSGANSTGHKTLKDAQNWMAAEHNKHSQASPASPPTSQYEQHAQTVGQSLGISFKPGALTDMVHGRGPKGPKGWSEGGPTLPRTYTDPDGIVHVQYPSVAPKRFNWATWDAEQKGGSSGGSANTHQAVLEKAQHDSQRHYVPGEGFNRAETKEEAAHSKAAEDSSQSAFNLWSAAGEHAAAKAAHTANPTPGNKAKLDKAKADAESAHAAHNKNSIAAGNGPIQPLSNHLADASDTLAKWNAASKQHSEGWDKWNSSYGMTPQVIQPGQMPAMAAMQQAGMQPGMMQQPMQQAAAPRPKAAPAGAQQPMQPGMGGMQPGMDQGVGMLPAPGLAIHTDDKSTMKQDANGNAHVEVNPDKRGSAWANPDHVKAALRGAEPGDNINAVHSEGQAVFGKVEKLGPTSVTIAAEKHGEIASPTDGKSVVVRHDRIHELTVEKGKPGEGGDSGDSAPAGDAGKKMTEGYYDVDGIFHRRVGVKA